MVEWFLYVIFETSQGNEAYRVAQPNQAECFRAAAATKLAVSNGAESERSVVVFCGGREVQRQHDGTWWRDQVKTNGQ
jgi:hypothetical protein